MHQTRKGNEWHFGIIIIAMNVHDIVASAALLLHDEEKRVTGDAGHLGINKRDKHTDCKVYWLINQCPRKRKHMEKSGDEYQVGKTKLQIRVKVEHRFATIKCQFGYEKVSLSRIERGCHNRLICWRALAAC